MITNGNFSAHENQGWGHDGVSLYSVEIMVSIKGMPRILGGGYTVNNLWYANDSFESWMELNGMQLQEMIEI